VLSQYLFENPDRIKEETGMSIWGTTTFVHMTVYGADAMLVSL